MIVERAYAKVNLTLEVIRKRNDGYHDLASILQTVDLYDTLEFEHCDGIEFECSDASLAGDHNLVMRAAKVLREVKDVGHGAKINAAAHLDFDTEPKLSNRLGSNQITLRRPELPAYRCFLPDLTGFTGLCRAGTRLSTPSIDYQRFELRHLYEDSGPAERIAGSGHR